jgi:hypothetical protein
MREGTRSETAHAIYNHASSMNHTTPTEITRMPILERLERDTLVAFASVLPLFEAPKSLLWIAFAVQVV